jgi:hypothetical protein
MGGALGSEADNVAPMASSVLKPITDSIGSALGGAVGGIVNNVTSVLGQAMKAFNPLQSLLGGFSPSSPISQMPFPFSPGGFGNPGIFNNPGGSIFPFPGVGQGGQQQTGFNESFSQLQNDLQNAVKSGDPMQMFQAQQKMNQYQEMVGMLSAMQKAEHDLITQITQKIA